jgi:hypothetical protein
MNMYAVQSRTDTNVMRQGETLLYVFKIINQFSENLNRLFSRICYFLIAICRLILNAFAFIKHSVRVSFIYVLHVTVFIFIVMNLYSYNCEPITVEKEFVNQEFSVIDTFNNNFGRFVVLVRVKVSDFFKSINKFIFNFSCSIKSIGEDNTSPIDKDLKNSANDITNNNVKEGKIILFSETIDFILVVILGCVIGQIVVSIIERIFWI